MIYEKLRDSTTIFDSVIPNDETIRQSREEIRTLSIELESLKSLDFSYPIFALKIGLEADDNPFGEIGDVEGSDPGLDSGTDNSSTDDDPFGDIGGGFDNLEDNSQDIFGGGEDSENNQKRKLELDRKKALKEEFDISRQIRVNFPKKFLQMHNIINTNIGILDRTIVDEPLYEELIKKLTIQFETVRKLIEAFISIMPKKTYEEIFSTYVSLYSKLVNLKGIYTKLTNTEDIAKEQLKENNAILNL